MRTIEYLRSYVRHRLDRHEYDSDSDSGRPESSRVVDNSRIDPMLHGRGDRVSYPSLPPMQ